MKPRVAIVAYSQETSSFTTQRTTLDTFRAYGLAEGPAVLENRSNHEIGGFLHELQAAGFEWEPCPVIHATAGAHGPLTACDPHLVRGAHHRGHTGRGPARRRLPGPARRRRGR